MHAVASDPSAVAQKKHDDDTVDRMLDAEQIALFGHPTVPGPPEPYLNPKISTLSRLPRLYPCHTSLF